MFREVRDILKKEIKSDDFFVSAPKVFGRGHAATNAAFVYAKEKNILLKEAADELKKFLLENAPKNFIAEIDIAGAGFLNITFTKEAIQSYFAKASKDMGQPSQPETRNSKLETRQRVIVEYSQPNIAKPMHVGHLRSTIIGDAIANAYEFVGWKVTRWNYLGDWGTQFGKLIAAYKKWGDEKKIEENPITELNNLYVKFHKELETHPELEEEGRTEFKKLEEGDKETRKLWEWFKKESLGEFQEMYNILGVEFDEWKSESFYEKDLPKLIERLEKEGVAKESEGALVVDLEKEGLPPALIRKSDGATLYLTRDIANLEYRLKKYKPDAILYVVDNGQSLHFQQLFAIAKKLGLDSAELEHVKFGLVLGEDLKKLSTRGGTGISLTDVVREGIERAKKVVLEKQPSLKAKERDEIARVVGVGALKYNDLSQNRQSDIAFDWDKMLTLFGNSGPYIQYTYARLSSILRKGKAEEVLPAGRQVDASALSTENDLNLILKLADFPAAALRVTETHLPSHLAGYLHELAKEVNAYYEKEPVLKAEEGVRDARLNLVNASAEVLKTGLGLLGIGVVERM